MTVLTSNAHPCYEATVWEYADRLVAHCECNRCGEKFSLTLHAHPTAIAAMTRVQKTRRIFTVAHARHSCDEASLPENPAETDRIVNKWHEYKLKAKRLFGTA